jgi:hypothetical protein
MPLPAGFESIAGATELYNWFGYWPDFHDAEVLTFCLNAGEPSTLAVHTWEMTNKVTEQGYYELTKHAVVEFVLEHIVNVTIVDLWEHSILLDLGMEKTETGYRLNFSAAYGISGTIEAAGISLRVTPGKPSSQITASS